MTGYQSDLAPDSASLCDALYRGELFHVGPTTASLALVEDVRDLLATELGPSDPRFAQATMDDAAFVAAIGRIRKTLFVDPRFRRHVVDVVAACGFDAAEVAFDPVRLRVVSHDGHHNPRAAPIYYAHRDTWFALSQSVIAWWIAMHDIPEEQTFAIYPEWFQRPIENSSAGFDYDAWAADSRDLKIGWQDREAGRIVHYSGATAAFDPGPQIRLAAKRGDNVVFSGTHLHQTIGHSAGHTRFSLDFRMVRLPDHEAGSGPPNVDNRSRGSATRDYVRG